MQALKIKKIIRNRWRHLLAAMCLCLPLAIRAEVVDITIEQLQTLMVSEDVTIIDVRTPREWQQTGIVTGSIPIMFFDEKRRPHAEQWLQQVSIYTTPEQELVLICRTGNRSKIIANYLVKQQGYTRVYNVKDGIKHWLRLGHETVAPQ